jgi:hypothetical protein
MSDAEVRSASQPDSQPGHGVDDHAHGHEAGAEPLGSIDTATWAYAIGGGAIGLIVALVLFVARGG